MGSHDFEITHPTVDHEGRPVSVREAYRSLFDDSFAEYGSDPYNGTISTTHGFRMYREEVISMTRARALIEEAHDTGAAEKWGDALCLKVGATKKVTNRSLTRTITLDVGEGYIPTYFSDSEVEEMLVPYMKEGEVVHSQEILEDNMKWSYKTTPAKGKTHRAYKVDQRIFDKKSEANQYARELLEDRCTNFRLGRRNEITVNIEDVVIRDGEGASRTAVATSRKLKVQAKVGRIGTPAEASHYFFFGSAAS